ncbi:MAG: M20 family metallopeptidase [Chloroflexota bacterium]
MTELSNSLVHYYSDHINDVVALTTTLANFETPTADKAHVDQMGSYLSQYLTELGAKVERIPRQEVGDILLAKWNAAAPGKPLMFMMHMDTVWPLGTLAQRPVHVEGDRLIGPGVWDMKVSIAMVLTAIKGLRDRSEFPDRPIWALFTSDEETGSVYSQDTITKYAAQAGLCLVMEFASPGNGGVRTWRKGVAHYTVNVKGLSSHAGNAPEKGINAVVEIAHQTLRISELNRMEHGTSVSVTVINGGIAFNVIPASASAQVDVRFLTKVESERIDQTLHTLKPVLPGAEVTTTLNGQIRPPMERDDMMIHNYEQLRDLALQLDFELLEDGSGGGSDGNFTAGMGIPTLDGLGAMGEGAHANHEQAVISSIPVRTALLDLIIRQWVFVDQD